ncbi:RTA1-like protein [Fomitiporia mediterranea MF3/22]|uniref:RTA1-like protein n=1 Tax=Fomitiporia mediterranea (strain MF3/22) TaxID=694068 RepID=UPI0004409351|nr:RTA1-like protein [Fomitiporia mediterranea MF3/22]EJD05847.1 RTA1-like protein [Fomitiporia mediterranea MF3/22]
MPSTPSLLVLALSALVILVLPVHAKTPENCAPDPYTDPRNDPCNVLKYIASNVLTGIAFGLYLSVGLCHIFSTLKWGAKWMSAMTVGIFTFVIGLGCRFGLHSNPQSKGIYIAEDLFILLSPCAFIAADYVLLGRLARRLDKSNYLWVSPQKVTTVFVLSDVSTFLIQAAGGAISVVANDQKTNDLGSNVFLAGLVLQLASFSVFTIMFLRFMQRIYTNDPETWNRDATQQKPWYRDWRTLAFALFVSCIGIIIRSVFRVVELSQGFTGALATDEAAFYGLDTLPLFIAVAVYVPFWPGRFIPKEPIKDLGDDDHFEMDTMA